MEYLDLKAEISPHKLNEFDQSKLSFIEELQKSNGYLGFTEKPGLSFQIRISWTNKATLKEFMESDYYRYFRGAIITLGSLIHANIVGK